MIKLISKDWGLKLASLILAVGLWYYAVGEEGIEVRRSIPLEIQLANEHVSILNTSAKNVWVTLLVPRGLLSDLASKEIKAVHKMGVEVNTSGDYSFRLETRDVNITTPQVRVLKVEPDTIKVSVDELIVQKLKIQPDFVGEPAFGYKVQENEMKLDPTAILVEGPKGKLEKLEAILTTKLDLIGRIRSFRRTVELSLPSYVKSLGETTVDVYVPIKEEFGEKEFDKIPLKIMSVPGSTIKVEPESSVVSFVLKGSQLSLEKLEPESMLAFLDPTGLEVGEQSVPIQIVLPDDVTLKEDVYVKVSLAVSSS